MQFHYKVAKINTNPLATTLGDTYNTGTISFSNIYKPLFYVLQKPYKPVSISNLPFGLLSDLKIFCSYFKSRLICAIRGYLNFNSRIIYAIRGYLNFNSRIIYAIRGYF